METRNCPRCGKLFTYMSSKLCDSCRKEEEETFQRIKTFIDDNPHNTLNEVSEELGVSPKRILAYIKEGRITVSKGLGNVLKCEHCGKPIKSGRFCDKCVISINSKVTEIFARPKTGAKMHTVSKK